MLTSPAMEAGLLTSRSPKGICGAGRTDGSERMQLTRPPVHALYPAWSPDGKRIAFEGNSPGMLTRVYVISAAGGAAQPVLKEQHNQQYVSWSADGSSVLISYAWFLETKPLAPVIVHLATHAIENLPGAEDLRQAEWSPNGRYIAARTVDRRTIKLFDSSTRKWLDLANSDVGFLLWSATQARRRFTRWTGKRLKAKRE